VARHSSGAGGADAPHDAEGLACRTNEPPLLRRQRKHPTERDSSKREINVQVALSAVHNEGVSATDEGAEPPGRLPAAGPLMSDDGSADPPADATGVDSMEPVAESARSAERAEPEDQSAEGSPAFSLGPDDLFLRINSVIPEAQEIVTIEPGWSCFDGLKLLGQRHFSQAPIANDRHVIGMFSYRSFAATSADFRQGCAGQLSVEDAMETAVWVRATDELGPLMDVFDAREAVLVGDEDDLQAIVTAMDVLRHLDSLSGPFVRLRGIELSLRQLVDAAVEPGVLAQAAASALAVEYEQRQDEPPRRTAEMTLGQLTAIVLHGPSWRFMKETLGANRANAATHLSGLSTLRNDVLHFRRRLEPDELEKIKTTSDWLRTRMRIADISEGSR
jgi:hypothetical protein